MLSLLISCFAGTLAMACANATPPQPARGAALLAELRGGGGQPSGEAANAVLAALCNAAMGRPNPACVNSAYEVSHGEGDG